MRQSIQMARARQTVGTSIGFHRRLHGARGLANHTIEMDTGLGTAFVTACHDRKMLWFDIALSDILLADDCSSTSPSI